MQIIRLFPVLLLLLAVFPACQTPPGNTDWGHYLGGPSASHHSPLTQINVQNVSGLKEVWRYSSGGADSAGRSQIQCNPLIINGILYGSSPELKYFALNAATGEKLWEFDPFSGAYNQFGMGVNRGLAFWKSGDESRILCTASDKLYALDAKTGQPFPSFGTNGSVNLHTGLGERAERLFVVSNTPGVVYQDFYILGTRVSEGSDAAPGYVRAFDIRTGELKWTFHTIPLPGEAGHETWPADAWQRVGGANSWAGMTLDEKRGLVFLPTGSASFDFYGGNREGENLYANCVLALEAATGKLRWHFQTIHHDIWDRDLPSPPNLITLNINGKKVDAVAQITKSGFVFVLDRETGKPLYPVEERPVPASEVPGEHAWPTQPVPVDLPAFARNTLTEADINPYSADRDSMLELFRSFQKGQQFIPASEQGTLIFPGFDGGGEWGGAAWDPATGVMYINSNEMAWVLKLMPNPAAKDQRLASYGERIYQMSCASCHGSDRKGTAFMGQAPALLGIKGRVTPELAEQKIRKGWGVMPAFAYFKDEEVKAVLAYLYDSPEMASPEFAKTLPEALPYTFTGYKKFLDKQGLPGISPPWGQLTALDIPNKKILWQIPFGEYPALKAKGIPPTGAENYGGPAVTAGGLLFIAAARDGKFRAYEKATGKLLWETQLPAAGYATPAVYEVNGKQFVVVACGGGKLGTPSGDSWIAFGL